MASGSSKRYRVETDSTSSKYLKLGTDNRIVNTLSSQITDTQVDSQQYFCDSAENSIDLKHRNNTHSFENSNSNDATDVDSQRTEINDSESSLFSGNSSVQGRLSRESTENYSLGQEEPGTSSRDEPVGNNDNTAKMSMSNIVSVQRDAAIIASVVEGVDFDDVYEKLKSHRANPNRVDLVTNQILESDHQATVEKPGRIQKEDSLPTDPAFRNDPLYKDMHVISKVLPDKDPNEIYAFLEAHHEKPNRILLVIKELTKTDSLESQSIPMTEEDESWHGTNGQKLAIEDEINELKDIFPDCDPNYLYNKLEEHQQAPGRVATIAAKMFDLKNYPKLEKDIETDEAARIRQNCRNFQFEIFDFLQKFPNAKEVFQSEMKSMSSLYKEHSLIHLKNEFPSLKDGYLKEVFMHHNHHLTPTLKEIQEEIPHLRGTSEVYKLFIV